MFRFVLAATFITLNPAARADEILTVTTLDDPQRYIEQENGPNTPVANQTWISDTLDNFDNNDSDLIGAQSQAGRTAQFRSFYDFDLSNVAGEVTGATLKVMRGAYNSSAPSETVAFSAAPYSPSLLNFTEAYPAEFDDLYGQTAVYATGTVTPGFSNDWLTFPLNVQALADINGLLNSTGPHLAGGLWFGISGDLLSLDGSSVPYQNTSLMLEEVFGSGVPAQLVLNVVSVPEPMSLVLMCLGLLALPGLSAVKGRPPLPRKVRTE